MIVGAGNAYVAEAKRQLFGRVGIDLLAGPSEVAIIADETADPELVAADLLGQAEHGPTSPAALVTTSEELGTAVLRGGRTPARRARRRREVAEAAWHDHGAVIVARDREKAATVSDELAPEHLEVHTATTTPGTTSGCATTARSSWAHAPRSRSRTRARRAPTTCCRRAARARYTGGLSVAQFFKTLTYQRIDHDTAGTEIAEAVVAISAQEGLAAHGATAAKRLARAELEGGRTR